MVDTADVIDHTVGAQTHQIAAAIQALPAANGLGTKRSAGQVRTAVITPGDAIATDVQLTGKA